MTIQITGNAKITMGGQDVTKIVKDKDTVSIEGLGCKIELCSHESPYAGDAAKYGGIKCIKCGELYR